MKTFTRADVLSWQPCHGRTKTLRIMRGLPRRMTALDVLRHTAASPEDRLWCVLRPAVLSERTLWLFAAWCARCALETERAAGREPDVRSWTAVETVERYALEQATGEDMHSACCAACDARPADDDAADDAAYAAHAAYAAARDAARAAYVAAAYAARAVARDAQVARLIGLIEEYEK